MYNRICEQTDLMGFFVRRGGYGMPGCPVFHRFARIDRPVEPPAKFDRVENSENGSATRSASRSLWRRHSARHGRNSHSSGIFTFFSFEEGSNFVQKGRQNRTSSTRWSVSFFLPPPYRHFAFQVNLGNNEFSYSRKILLDQV